MLSLRELVLLSGHFFLVLFFSSLKPSFSRHGQYSYLSYFSATLVTLTHVCNLTDLFRAFEYNPELHFGKELVVCIT